MLTLMRIRIVVYISYIIYIMLMLLWVIVYVTPMPLHIIVETPGRAGRAGPQQERLQ